MRETYVTVAGVVATDPQVRQLDDGRQVMSFRVASTSRKFDNHSRSWVDGHTLWVKVSCWRELADNASQCVRKRDRVVAWGRLHTEQWKGGDGAVRTDLALDAEALGHDLAFGVAVFERKRRTVSQRTLTDVPGIDPETGELVAVSPGVPGPDVTVTGAGRPDAEFDEELEDELDAEVEADAVEEEGDGGSGSEVAGDVERELLASV